MLAARLKFGILLCSAAVIGTCSHPPSLLDEVRQTGELRVVTRNGPTAYFEDGGGPSGPEYDLLRGFAEELGVRLQLVVVAKSAQVLPALLSGEAHLAAAGLTISPEAERLVDFGPVYQQITEHIVYRDGRRRPRDLSQLRGKRLEIPSGASYVKSLLRAQSQVPELVWTEDPHADQNELLNRVARGALDYTIVKSNSYAMYRSYIPEIRVAFNLAEGESVAWAFPKRADPSLRQAAERYFARIRASGELDRIMDSYYGHVFRSNYVGTRQFLLDVRSKLPAYRQLFKTIAAEFGLDWRLLAAIGYQESKWDPDAVSPTGVRGLMMLTEETAAAFGVDDRTDAVQSIRGGARYLTHILGRMPKDATEPDRMAFALATYNMGFGHLLDARRLSRDEGSDWNRWVDVRRMVKKLADPDFAAQTRHGFARGGETVWFVDNVRAYFDVLAFMTRDEIPLPGWMQQRAPAPVQADATPGGRHPERLALRQADGETT